jgi:hypothetical protein
VWQNFSANVTITKALVGTNLKHPSSDTTARTLTIDSNANQNWVDGTTFTFWNLNGAGNVVIAVTTNTLRRSGTGATGNRTLSANGIATIVWDAASLSWIIYGDGLT